MAPYSENSDNSADQMASGVRSSNGLRFFMKLVDRNTNAT